MVGIIHSCPLSPTATIAWPLAGRQGAGLAGAGGRTDLGRARQCGNRQAGGRYCPQPKVPTHKQGGVGCGVW